MDYSANLIQDSSTIEDRADSLGDITIDDHQVNSITLNDSLSSNYDSDLKELTLSVNVGNNGGLNPYLCNDSK